jgi:hypothetical protein
MSFYSDFKKNLFTISKANFNDHALALFDYQYHTNEIYRTYCDFTGINQKRITKIEQIPFLPIDFFRQHEVKSEKWVEEKIFLSSGTTQNARSKNLVRDLNFYHEIVQYIFEQNFDPLKDYQLLALLPSYQEHGNSSLIEMINHFLKFTQPGSDFFAVGRQLLEQLLNDEKKLLIGVSYALLDLNKSGPVASNNLEIMETGGMKGRKREIVRNELHDDLIQAFKVNKILTEYGMTELMSQAYSKKDGNLYFPSWAKCLIRDINDPWVYLPTHKPGGINIIDLANISTCAFIETKDLGLSADNQCFNVIGRFDNSDIRGCSLLI